MQFLPSRLLTRASVGGSSSTAWNCRRMIPILGNPKNTSLAKNSCLLRSIPFSMKFYDESWSQLQVPDPIATR